MELRIFVLLGVLSLAYCVTEEDFYPFDRLTDERLPNGDSTSSHKIALRVPAKFYDTEYDYVWINIDGYISFEPDLTEKSRSDFPFEEALLSPFMSDLDTTRRGEIYYRESNDAEILSKANDDIRSAFPRAAAGFDAESVFIVTWHGVEGRSIDGTIARFTFQCIIVSNGRDSYAIFLYPEKKMGQVPAGVRMKSALFQARAGFNQGRKQFLEMYPVESLVDHRNGRRKGEWIYQIGGEGVRTNKEVIAPERVRTVKRQTTVLNVQEVNLAEEEDDNFIETSNERRVYDYCSHDADACLANNSECVNYDSGYCCRCLSEFYGNGKVCVGNQEPISVNGNVSGVVDVKNPDGSISRQTVNDVTFHSYMVTSDSRAYTAISNVSPVLGRALQPISPIGEIVGWLFAVPTPPAVNGFQFTGGNFQRQVSIRYENSDFKFDLRQRFMGVRSEGNTNMVVGHTTFVGFLPSIPDGAPVTMESYEDEYVKQAPGRFSSTSVRNYTVNNREWQYTINQAIIFNECRDSLSSVPDTLMLSVSDAFLNYHDDDDNVRYAMNSRISASGSLDPSHPCSTGAHNCDIVIAQCEPLVGSEYTCRCRDGYAGDGRVCDDIDECVENRCGANQECLNSAGSYSCVCRGGFQLNARGECEVNCPSNQVYSTCAGCSTTCDERFAPKVCTLQCRQECTCPANLPYLNGDMCVTADQCPRPTDSSIPICTLRNNEATNWLLEHPNEQYPPSFFDCDSNGLFEKRQCNDQTNSCWCVEPSTGTRIDGTEGLLSCEPCIEKNVEIENFIRENPRLQDGPERYTCDDYGLFEKEQCGGFSRACWCVNPRNGSRIGGLVTDGRANCERNCPGNQVFSTCAGCSTTCDERFAPKICTLQCRQQCTCPANLPYLNGDMCVTGDQCPRPTNELEGPCTIEYNRQMEWLSEHPGILDGPDFPECSSDGYFENKQCNDFTRVCWCVDTRIGTQIPGTEGKEDCSSPCPGNQVFSTCAGCITTCAQRFRPPLCDRRCHRRCTCPQDAPYLNDGVCLSAEQCPSTDPNSGPCTQRRNEVAEWQRQHPDVADGPDFPECDEDGLYRRTQCNDWTRVCWCVDPLIGSMIAGTSGREDCDESSPVPLTLCQRTRQEAEREAENRPDVFQPICTEAGAFEPIQYHVEGYYSCIDINGEEISRHTEQPECLTACQLQAYYAETDNNLLGTEKFVPQCTGDGRFSSIQCDQATQSCYCADQNGQEISGTRESTSGGSPNYLECPDNNQPSVPNRPVQLLMANTRSINAIDLPVSVTSTARRLFSRSGRMAIGIAFDCSSQKIYWTDVATRAIYMSPLSDPSNPTVIVSGLRSPEGVAVDFITGNIFWTDSGLDRIGVASADGSYTAVLVSTGLSNPRGIAVDPFGGKMYWTDWDRQNPRIMKANMDGTEVEVFIQEDITLPNNLAIDPFFRRLCFIDDAKIKCMNMDKSGLETVWTNTAMGKPFDLAVNGHKLYYSNRIRSSTGPSRIKRVFAVDTASLISTPLSGPLGEHGNVFGVAVASTSCPTGYNGCFRANGGCRNLCLPVPNGKTCKCPDNDPSCQ